MTSKERVQLIFEHKNADRVPINATYTPEIAALLKEHVGECDDVGVAMGNDFVVTCCGRGFATSYYREGAEYVCDYGIRWRSVNFGKGTYTEMVERPLEDDPDKLKNWHCPDPFEPTQYDALRQKQEKFGKDKWMVGDITCTIFETAWALRGMENLLCDMYEDEDFVDELFDKVMQHPLQAGIEAAKIGVDMLWMGDDVAIQQGMLMDPKLFRRFLKPRFAKMIEEYRKINPNIKIAYHSCGNPEKILPDLIDVGVNAYHSIQPRAINPLEVKKKYGDKLVLFGGLDIQKILPMGSPDDVRAEVRRLIDGCADNGGYILAPAHHIQPDVPLENILAFYDEGNKYGVYK